MRVLKIMLIVLVVCVVSALLPSCRSASDTVSEAQVVTVQRGDLTIDITAVGNLAFSHQEELTFEVGGTIAEVPVEAGDSVEEGQVLAKLDDTSIISLQKAVIQARINLETAQEALEKAEDPYTESDIIQAELSVINAEIALKTAQDNLEDAEDPYSDSDIAQAELAVINAVIALDVAQDNLERAEEKYKLNRSVKEREWDYEQKKIALAIAEFNLTEAEDDLADMKAGADPLEVEQKQKQLALAQANLKEAEDDLAEMLGSVDSLEVELKRSEVASTQAALDEAIERLEMATMVAPFAGIVTSVNVEAGEAVNANQVVIELVDTDKFETEILVNETDIFNIQMGAEASIQVDSMSGISLPAAVTTISPIATIQSGVVNYKVTVELESMESLALEPPAPDEEEESQEVPQSVDEVLDKAVADGRISQEQADMMKQRFSQMDGSPTPEELEQMIEGFGQRQGGILLENIELKEGLTVTVSVIVEERYDVLLVPNTAISTSGRQTYVQVLSSDGTIEERAITTGISDWQYTEIVEGLNEGEKVVVPETTTTTSTTQQEGQGGIMPFSGGGGGIHR